MRLAVVSVLLLAACGGTQHPVASPRPVASEAPSASPSPAPVASASPRPVYPHETAPVVPPGRDIRFPTIARSTLRNGLELDVLEYHSLPVVHLRLVARAAGSSADPANLPGLAAFAGDMLKEGTRSRTSAEFADAVEFLGGTIAVATSPDATVINVAVLRDHLDEALDLLADMVINPAFTPVEIEKLRRREVDRLTQEMEDPSWLSRREFYRAIYGEHPYAHVDTTPEALRRFTRADIVAFHRNHFVAGSMLLAVVGDVHANEFTSLAERTLGRIRRGHAPNVRFPEPPRHEGRQVILVDRPGSAQSVIRIGNLSLRRASDEYVPLAVANQILGGDAASRLFMDLRERRSLTYGAYSRVTGNVDVGTFQASGSVRTPVTAEAAQAFFEHLDRIVREPPGEDEIRAAHSYLTDSFPLAIETPGEVASLVVDLRVFGLPDTYWDTYRSRIGQVTAAQSLQAAQQYIHPDHAVVVFVGDAATIETAARHWGAVRVVSADGRLLRELPAEH